MPCFKHVFAPKNKNVTTLQSKTGFLARCVVTSEKYVLFQIMIFKENLLNVTQKCIHTFLPFCNFAESAKNKHMFEFVERCRGFRSKQNPNDWMECDSVSK